MRQNVSRISKFGLKLSRTLRERTRKFVLRLRIPFFAPKSGALDIVIATDVAARGIDVAGLSFVIHHTLPDQMEYYTHRSGRTARAGKKGVSIALVDPQEKWKIAQMETKLRVSFSEYQK